MLTLAIRLWRRLGDLQSQLQVVCAWTHRIRIEGKWLTLDEFLQEKLNVKVSHGISQEALAEMKKQFGKESQDGLSD